MRLFKDKALQSLYKTITVPYLFNCVGVLGKACKTIKKFDFFILQKRAGQIITRKCYRHPTNTLFYQLKFLKCHDLVEYYILNLLYKLI